MNFEKGEWVIVVTANNEAILGIVITNHGPDGEGDTDRVTIEYTNEYGGKSRMHPTRDRVGKIGPLFLQQLREVH